MGAPAFMKEFREFMNMPEGMFGGSHARFGNCDSCMAKFGLLKRKHPCDQCGTNFCASCVRGRRCPRCRALAAGRPALLALRVRDLRALLRARGLAPPLGAAEKTELVDLLLLGSASTERSGRQPEPQPEPTSHARSEGPSPAASTSSRGRTPPSMPQWGGPFHPDEAYSDEDEAPPAGPGGPFPAASRACERTPPVMPQWGGPFVHEDTPSQESQPHQEQEEPVAPGNSNSGVGGIEVETLLEQVESEEQLGQLTVLQMKLMLTRNFIDYRGCCEKAELYERLRWLWNQKRKHQHGEGVPEEDMCKICMEEGVDCVILDCGHMCTCTNCGKQLSECPICRQYVVRVVHVFRA
ncbi:E3 ubiquitin-protein ligase rififylin-like isoform X1 [Haemaphysalis longicornis]